MPLIKLTKVRSTKTIYVNTDSIIAVGSVESTPTRPAQGDHTEVTTSAGPIVVNETLDDVVAAIAAAGVAV